MGQEVPTELEENAIQTAGLSISWRFAQIGEWREKPLPDTQTWKTREKGKGQSVGKKNDRAAVAGTESLNTLCNSETSGKL